LLHGCCCEDLAVRADSQTALDRSPLRKEPLGACTLRVVEYVAGIGGPIAAELQAGAEVKIALVSSGEPPKRLRDESSRE